MANCPAATRAPSAKPRLLARFLTTILATAIAIGISGCGTSKVVKQYGARFSETSAPALEASRQYFAKLLSEQAEVVIELVATDSNCPLRSEIHLKPVESVSNPRAPKDFCNTQPPAPRTLLASSICLNEADLEQRDCDPDAWDAYFGKPELLRIDPLRADIFDSSLTLIGAFADYTASIAELSDAPTLTLESDFKSLIERLTRLKSKLEVLQGDEVETPTPEAAAVFTKQLEAVGSLISFFEELARNAEDAKKIRLLVNTQGEEQETKLLAVRESIELWHQYYERSVLQSKALILQSAYAVRPKAPFETYEKRRLFVLKYAGLITSIDQMSRTSAAPDKLIAKTVEIHRRLRNLSAGNPDDEQRREIRAASRQELETFFRRLYGAVTAF